MKPIRLPLVAALALAGQLAVPAASGKLGDAAPPLKVAEWVKGQPVDLAAGKGKTVYVIEFWATWCGPCRQSIPHLTEMQKKFKDQNVVFVGVTGEDADAVKPFVKKMGDQMDYVVAVDDDNQTSAGYMEAFGIGGIPHAFVVDKEGRILWHGHPMDHLDAVLAKVAAGKYDLAAARQEAQEKDTQAALQRQFGEYLQLARSGREPARAEDLGNQLIREVTDDPEILNQFAWTILTAKRLRNRDTELALAAATAAVKASGGKDPLILQTYARALFAENKVPEAVKEQKRAVQLASDEDLRKQFQTTLSEYEARLKPAK